MADLESMVANAAVADVGDAAIMIGTANTNPMSTTSALSLDPPADAGVAG